MNWANILKKDETNYGQIVKPFRQWARECRAKGETIGTSSGDTLRQMLLNHVTKQRPGVSGARTNAYAAIRKLEQLTRNASKISEANYKTIIALIPYLEGLEKDKDSNPANIKFTTHRSVKKGKGRGKTIMRGHWRTNRYNKNKTAMDEYAISPVADDWYVEGTRSGDAPLFQAMPPLWQALFATPEKNSSSPVVKVGLLHILKEYKKEVEK
tara:strand:+ start:1128 stop:1763 length:636 start_codon:yes stop_codon:yes gene_type:complete